MATAKPKHAGGRPSKLKNVNMDALKLLCVKGFTDVEISQVLGITEKTFNNWKNKNEQFLQSIKDWKVKGDQKVVRALYERACGYEHPEDKVFCDKGDITVHETTKYYPPDTAAAFIWLKNRLPKDWADKREVDLTLNGNEEMANIIAGAKAARKGDVSD